MEGLQTSVLDLVLEIGDDLNLSFAHRGVLKAGDLNPCIDLLDAERQAPGRLQDAEGEHTLLLNARLLRVQLRDAFAGGDLKSHALLRHYQQRATLLAGFAQEQLRRGPIVGGSETRPGQTDRELLLALGFAAQVQCDQAPGIGFHFGPMAQGRTADGFDVEAGRHQEAEPENPCACDRHRGIGRQDCPVFPERKGVLRLDAHVGFNGGSLQGK